MYEAVREREELSEDHRIVAEGPPAQVLAERQLLLDVNLIHAQTRLPTGDLGTVKEFPPGGNL